MLEYLVVVNSFLLFKIKLCIINNYKYCECFYFIKTNFMECISEEMKNSGLQNCYI